MKYNGTIQRKLTLLDEQVGRLEKSLEGVGYGTFKDDWILRSMAERALQVSVEIMIDIADRIIALEGAGPTAGASEAMKKLASLRVLASEQPYADMVRFRNLIVHEYEKIDPEILFNLATKRLEVFRRFRDELDKAMSLPVL